MAVLASLAGPFKRPTRLIRRSLPPLNFITIHYAYFIGTCLISAIILWGADSHRTLRFIDALFLAVSAMSLAGLNTVNLSTLNTFQQFWLFLLIMIGSAVLVSAFVVQVRKRAFATKFAAVVEQERQRKSEHRSRSRSRAASRHTTHTELDAQSDQHDVGGSQEPPDSIALSEDGPDKLDNVTDIESADKNEDNHLSEANTPEAVVPRANITFRQDTRFPDDISSRHVVKRRSTRSLWSAQGVGARSNASLDTHALPHDLDSRVAPPPKNGGNIARYFDSKAGWIGRNSQFHGLTDKERERLGGYEYRAVCFLAWLVPIYLFLMQFLGCIGCGAWVAYNRPGTTRSNGLNPWWTGAFNAVSAFNNSGMSLLDANMVAFQTGYYLLITMSFLILAGNTCYPIFLRLIIWCIWKIVQRLARRSEKWADYETMLKFLLDHPRRCYTNLFPSRHTWWLLASVVALNVIDWVAFEVLNIGNKNIEALPVGVRVIDGLFQAFAVRSGGFYIVAISSVRISLQVLYVVMMYISVYPVVITMRNSNVYEERSLGIYADDIPEDEEHEKNKPGFLQIFGRHFVSGGASNSESNSTFVRQQLRAQLAHDIWTIVTALFLVMIIETGSFDRDPATFSVFNFLFEIVSAYGCVGISIGLPNEAYSFSGSWHTLSKLILCFVMLKGRHRGLPVAIDRAVLLPGERTDKSEEDDGRIRLHRTISRGRSLHGDV